MDIDQQYKHLIHTDATALLRPRTGLKDMFIELNPGSSQAPTAKPGYTIPVANTLPDINVDEILASLDADTRAYLTLLINGAGHGLRGNGGSELAQVLERFEPTHRDLARVSRAVAKRGANLRRLVNSLQRLNTALAAKQGQIVQLVDSSSRVFRAFAAEQGNVSRAVADLPGTLSQTTATLAQVQAFADQLGPLPATCSRLHARCRRQTQALAALAKPSAPIVQKQIRPFVVAARPVVHDLSPAAVDLATATPNLAKGFVVLNHLVNMLGYSPGGGQHGYLWWLAWLGHNTRTLFSLQDANGPYRPLFIQFSCPQIGTLTNSGSPFALVGSAVEPDAAETALPGLGPAHDTQRCERAAPRRRRRAPRTDVHQSPFRHEDRHDGAVRALLRRAAAVPVAVVRRHDSVQPPGVPLPGVVPKRPGARDPGRRPDRRRVGRQGGRQVARSAGQPHDRDDRARQAVRADPRDARAILREKTIIGETYVELTPGSPSAPLLPDGGLLARSNVEPAVQLDQIFNALDPVTRRAFQVWQQQLAIAVRGNGQNLNSVIGNLPQFTADATDVLRVLDIEHMATVRLVQNGGTVFAALSQNQSALRNLITSAGATFATTAANNNALADTFHVLPTFLNETKATFARLKVFALDTDPLVKELVPVAQQLTPTLSAVRTLSPDLQRLFVELGPLVTASETGFPALSDVLRGAEPLLGVARSVPRAAEPDSQLALASPAAASRTSSRSAPSASRRRRPPTAAAGSRAAASHAGTTCASSPRSALRPQGSPAAGTSTAAATPIPRRCGSPTRRASRPAGTFPGSFALPSWDCKPTGAPGNGSRPATATIQACWVAPPLPGAKPGQIPHILAAHYPSK